MIISFFPNVCPDTINKNRFLFIIFFSLTLVWILFFQTRNSIHIHIIIGIVLNRFQSATVKMVNLFVWKFEENMKKKQNCTDPSIRNWIKRYRTCTCLTNIKFNESNISDKKKSRIFAEKKTATNSWKRVVCGFRIKQKKIEELNLGGV
mgnify:CR=1 FL=1